MLINMLIKTSKDSGIRFPSPYIPRTHTHRQRHRPRHRHTVTYSTPHQRNTSKRMSGNKYVSNKRRTKQTVRIQYIDRNQVKLFVVPKYWASTTTEKLLRWTNEWANILSFMSTNIIELSVNSVRSYNWWLNGATEPDLPLVRTFWMVLSTRHGAGTVAATMVMAEMNCGVLRCVYGLCSVCCTVFCF